MTSFRKAMQGKALIQAERRSECEDIYLVFEQGWKLVIYNRCALIGVGGVSDLVGRRLASFERREKDEQLVFEGGAEVVISLDNAAYVTGPEALVLHSPQNATVVWN